MDFRLLIDVDVLEFVEQLPQETQDGIRVAIRDIRRNPDGQSEAEDHDSTGRSLCIKIVGDHALTYWIDHTDRHIKIMDIHSADR